MDRSNCTFIITALSRVDSEYSSTALSLADELSKSNKVFYINHPYTFKDLFKKVRSDERIRKMTWKLLLGQTVFEQTAQPNLTSVVVPFAFSINWMPAGSTFFSVFQRINEGLVLRAVRSILKKQQPNEFIYLNIFNPYFVGALPKKYGARLSIYQSVDDISQNSYTAKHGVALEQRAAKNSDIIFVTSSSLKEKLRAINPKVHQVNNAADFRLFQQAVGNKLEVPDELKGVAEPVLGYTGNLDDTRIDFHLLKEIALQLPHCKLVLVGPLNSEKYHQVGLHKLPNVIATGGKRIDELPAYLAHMKVVLIPFALNKLTASIYPLKINEYLAAGKAVVSTRFSKDIEDFEQVIKIGDSTEQILKHIAGCLEQDATEEAIQERVAVAATNTWANRVEQIWDHVADAIK